MDTITTRTELTALEDGAVIVDNAGVTLEVQYVEETDPVENWTIRHLRFATFDAGGWCGVDDVRLPATRHN